jgi:hypothetical protein
LDHLVLRHPGKIVFLSHKKFEHNGRNFESVTLNQRSIDAKWDHHGEKHCVNETDNSRAKGMRICEQCGQKQLNIVNINIPSVQWSIFTRIIW